MNKTLFEQYIYTIYLLLLGVCIGVEVCIGAFVAPVIFHPSSFLGDGVLTHFQSGVLMTQIFLKFNILLLFVAIFIFFYELYRFFKKRMDFVSYVLMLIILCCTILFVFYYTPFIVEAQSIGTTTSEKFSDMHKGSEWVLKIAILAQVGLFFRTVLTQIKNSRSS